MTRALLLSAILLGATSPALAIDAACTTTTNLSIYRCPDGSTDWYESYTGIIDELDILAKTAKSSFTILGAALVSNGSAGAVTANAAADDLVVTHNGSGGITILVPDANNATYALGSLDDEFAAAFRWNHDGDLATLGTFDDGGTADLAFVTGNNAEAVRILQNGNVGVGTAGPGHPLHVVSNDTYVIVSSPTAGGSTSGIAIWGDADHADDRNYAIITESDANGDLAIQRSANPSANPSARLLRFNLTETAFNTSGGDQDFRVETDNDANTLFVNGGTDRVGIGIASPAEEAHVVGDVQVSSATTSGGVSMRFRGAHDAAPGTCTIGDFYVDVSGAACFCDSANNWIEMGTGAGSCS